MPDLTFEQALTQAQARFAETLATIMQLATGIERWGRSLTDAQAAALFLIYPPETVKWLLGKKRYYRLYTRYRRVYRLPRQRSSRRLAVQAKRAARGLDIWGKPRSCETAPLMV